MLNVLKIGILSFYVYACRKFFYTIISYTPKKIITVLIISFIFLDYTCTHVGSMFPTLWVAQEVTR